MKDAWELGDDECHTVDCDECEREYDITRHVSVTYSTKKPTPRKSARQS
jgi:hypothetical protein